MKKALQIFVLLTFFALALFAGFAPVNYVFCKGDEFLCNEYKALSGKSLFSSVRNIKSSLSAEKKVKSSSVKAVFPNNIAINIEAHKASVGLIIGSKDKASLYTKEGVYLGEGEYSGLPTIVALNSFPEKYLPQIVSLVYAMSFVYERSTFSLSNGSIVMTTKDGFRFVFKLSNPDIKLVVGKSILVFSQLNTNGIKFMIRDKGKELIVNEADMRFENPVLRVVSS